MAGAKPLHLSDFVGVCVAPACNFRIGCANGLFILISNSVIRTFPQEPFFLFLVFDEFNADNPSFYADLKAADFKVDGKPLPANSVIQIALAAGDTDYVAAMPVRVAGIVAETSLKWEDVLELSPLRLKYVARAIRKRRTLDKLAYFDAQSALIDEKSLSRLNSELRD